MSTSSPHLTIEVGFDRVLSYELRVLDVIIEVAQNFVVDSVATGILLILRLLHFSLVILVEEIGMEDDQGICDKVDLI